ncbi:peptide/nickel transport system permease protein [Alicyclobacillus hesperidum]|uniref:Peptide/nickel transport system permease protein n=1 Tax=Alicyclobacillus hesperidum TaxID=89784 RepID=A0A1H2SS43_9BACL|nr:ABC transporter permease [Alicyclobacillus hesperidum]SDW34347.1 peptide/nickel transport system permease protein [Alicyclobacillus hesperidum]
MSFAAISDWHERASHGRKRRRRLAWRRFCRNGLPVIGLAYIALLFIVAIVGPFVTRQPTVNIFQANQSPSWAHPFGTGQYGQDLLTQIVRGLGGTLLIGVTGAAISVAIGLIVGMVAGVFGGFIDAVLMRLTDFAFSIPTLIIALFIVVVTGFSAWNVGLSIGLVTWAGCARLARGLALSVRNGTLIDSAILAGGSRWYIATRYVLPQIASNMIVFFVFQVASVLFQSTTLIALDPQYVPLTGGQLPPGSNLLLNLLNGGGGSYIGYRWLFWFPLGVYCSMVIALLWIGDGLQALLNPQQPLPRRWFAAWPRLRAARGGKGVNMHG